MRLSFFRNALRRLLIRLRTGPSFVISEDRDADAAAISGIRGGWKRRYRCRIRISAAAAAWEEEGFGRVFVEEMKLRDTERERERVSAC